MLYNADKMKKSLLRGDRTLLLCSILSEPIENAVQTELQAAAPSACRLLDLSLGDLCLSPCTD